MHIAFLDIAAAYKADAPFTAALGGTQSAVCYLAAALVKNGHAATLINQNRETGYWNGVASASPEILDADAQLNQCDVLVCNSRWSAKMVRGLKARTQKPLVAWMHEAALADPYIQACPEFSAFVFVSQWQEKINKPALPPAIQSVVIPNGIAPAFHNCARVKKEVPIAIYAGSSKRGLLDLPEIIPALNRTHPDLRFEIYSECAVSQNQQDCENFRHHLRSLPQTDYVGAVSQTELAARMARAHFFLSPNTYPETFCIALAEAMAAGLHPIITARAALPETANGFATLVPVADPHNPEWVRGGLDIENYCQHAPTAITHWQRQPKAIQEAAIEKQMVFARTHYNWQTHAEKWVSFLQTLN